MWPFLQSLFPLPFRQNLTVLNTVCFRTGVSANVFSTLRCTLQIMSDEDHLCCLTFDEMSIRGNLHFNQKFGCIEGFKDLESQGRTSNIANHALVFKLHGLCKKWKQAIAYCLIHTSRKGEMLVNFLMEVFDVCYDGGPEVFLLPV